MGLFDRVSVEARSLDLVRVVLTVIAFPLFAAGWLAAHALRCVLFIAAWLMTAPVAGWKTARGEVEP